MLQAKLEAMRENDLPVKEVLPKLDMALAQHHCAVLVAPPGAGKTTLVPLHLLNAPWRKDGMIVLLEPRRLAARASARRMAFMLGEEVGETVGYRMRLDSRLSDKTRILVVTEGVFARMILDEPELKGIAAVLFDEYHERSLDADFGLALALDVQGALRPDLKLLVMSATLDGARIAALLGDAPVVESLGRAYPVDIRYQPRKAEDRLDNAMASAVLKALHEEEGSILAFLPGQREIERTAALLKDRVGGNVHLAPLYGAMDAGAQDLAIRATQPHERKVVLATSIAESSLTIDGVRIVIDSGLSRIPVYEAATGITKLETVRASRASVDQRAGRAGRTVPGIAIRLWHEGQTASLPQFTDPEILHADLSNIVLDGAAFGIKDITAMTFLDLPPVNALHEATLLLQRLGALDDDKRITALGQAMRHTALPVRLAAMVYQAQQCGDAYGAALLAVLLTERGLGGNSVDLERRLETFKTDRSERANKARKLAERLSKKAEGTNSAGPIGKSLGESRTVSQMLLDAWPDRVAKSRGQQGRFVLANGRGGVIDETSPLAGADYLVVAELSGQALEARILAAAELREEDLREALASKIKQKISLEYDRQSKTFKARQKETLGALTLCERALPLPQGEEADRAMIDAIRTEGLDILPWTKEAKNLRERLFWLHQGLGEPWPDMSDENLLVKLDEWLMPFLNGVARLDSITTKTLTQGLTSLVPYALQPDIAKKAPTHFTVPTGSQIAIRYEGEAPVLSVRVQELYGLNTHPSIAGGKIALLVELLSPAHRPIQITRDLPGFWKGSWADVRADQRGRYPKHLWPEDPLLADPTRRAKPRGS